MGSRDQPWRELASNASPKNRLEPTRASIEPEGLRGNTPYCKNTGLLSKGQPLGRVLCHRRQHIIDELAWDFHAPPAKVPRSAISARMHLRKGTLKPRPHGGLLQPVRSHIDTPYRNLAARTELRCNPTSSKRLKQTIRSDSPKPDIPIRQQTKKWKR